MKSDTMELNRKTAMELWKRQFGKTDRATDYAGRDILKAAYDDRGSAYGWNVDHILPKSRGGKTAEHNLICCHMETNSEKADKFPCFTANDTRFEGYVTICFDTRHKEVDGAFVRFVSKLFEGERIALDGAQHLRFAVMGPSSRRRLLLRIHGLNYQQDTQRILRLCVLLNTYMKGYLCAQGLIEDYSLYYEIGEFSSELEALCTEYSGKDFHDKGLVVSESVKQNTDLRDKQLRPSWNSFSFRGADYEYEDFYPDLKKELEEI